MTSRDAADLIHLMRKELTELTCDTREEEVCKHVSLIVAPILYEMGKRGRGWACTRLMQHMIDQARICNEDVQKALARVIAELVIEGQNEPGLGDGG